MTTCKTNLFHFIYYEFIIHMSLPCIKYVTENKSAPAPTFPIATPASSG